MTTRKKLPAAKTTRKVYKEVFPSSRRQWRNWLKKNFSQKESVWLIVARKGSGLSSLTVADAVEEALCFGWIDSLANKVDTSRFKILMAPRRPKSNWSKVNKGRIRRLIQSGLMQEPGLEAIKAAKKSGSWTALDDIED
jgi:uncharacterized protein YdeI (YjbR/CyaY-like superfamily)